MLLVDPIDHKILAELEENGRLTITELAARIKLSVSPCHRRLRELERTGAIRGYRAIVDPVAVGLGFQALVFASLHQADRDTVARFEDALLAIPQVLQAQRLFGDPDYLLRVAPAWRDSISRSGRGTLRSPNKRRPPPITIGKTISRNSSTRSWSINSPA